jgi:hypothetical protein
MTFNILMSCLGNSYNPIPTRRWTRYNPNCNNFVGLSTANILENEHNLSNSIKYKLDVYKKGNVLQYKKNSSNTTKAQKYSSMVRGTWVNANKVWATQSQTYTNPNTNLLKLVNNGYYLLPQPIQTPTHTETIISDGGTLLCNIIQNPYTGQTLSKTYYQECYPTTCSDVPGKPIFLCWNKGIQTYYPKTKLTYGNSNNKFPTNAKFIIAAN